MNLERVEKDRPNEHDLTPQDSMFVWAILIIFTLADIAVIAWMRS